MSFADWGSGKSFYSVDFTELTRPGKYRLQVGSLASPLFEIGSGYLFEATVPAVLDYFSFASKQATGVEPVRDWI